LGTVGGGPINSSAIGIGVQSCTLECDVDAHASFARACRSSIIITSGASSQELQSSSCKQAAPWLVLLPSSPCRRTWHVSGPSMPCPLAQVVRGACMPAPCEASAASILQPLQPPSKSLLVLAARQGPSCDSCRRRPESSLISNSIALVCFILPSLPEAPARVHTRKSDEFGCRRQHACPSCRRRIDGQKTPQAQVGRLCSRHIPYTYPLPVLDKTRHISRRQMLYLFLDLISVLDMRGPTLRFGRIGPGDVLRFSSCFCKCESQPKQDACLHCVLQSSYLSVRFPADHPSLRVSFRFGSIGTS
jgi:hypothetical protein